MGDDRKRPIELHVAGLHLPDVVTVLAPGPNGRDYWSEAEGCVVAVNRAIHIPVEADFWLVADGNAQGLEWFERGYRKYPDVERIFLGTLWNAGYACEYTVRLHSMDWDRENNRPAPYVFRPDYFRSTESVSGIAMEFACRFGAKRIKLIGVDLEGGYYDAPDDDLYSAKPCIFRETIPLMMEYWTEQGIEFEVVSPSRLREAFNGCRV